MTEKELKAERSRRYYAKNKERILLQQAAYKGMHKVRISETARRIYAKQKVLREKAKKAMARGIVFDEPPLQPTGIQMYMNFIKGLHLTKLFTPPKGRRIIF